MWLLNVHSRKLESFEGNKIPKYAILSHRWEEEEVTFKDVMKRSPENLKGYYKIDMCCRQAEKEQLSYVWIDTCCIDKRSSAELSEAINSMYKWYQRAEICYAYLSDVEQSFARGEDGLLSKSLWFTRGWTLQELLAPAAVHFFDSNWCSIGSKESLANEVSEITKIKHVALKAFDPDKFSIVERMSWASGRHTSREEDQAYCLFGIFKANMPLLYGEGMSAFTRLQEEIIKTSEDRSILLWSPSSESSNSPLGIFADSPSDFSTHLHVESIPERVLPIYEDLLVGQHDFTLSNVGLRMNLRLFPLLPNVFLARLGACQSDQFDGNYTTYIFVQADKSIADFEDRFSRVSISGRSWVTSMHLIFHTEFNQQLDLALRRPSQQLSVYLTRRPLTRIQTEDTCEYSCRVSRVSDRAIYDSGSEGSYQDVWPEDSSQERWLSIPRGTMTVPLAETFSFVGCFFGIDSHSQIIVIAVGFDSRANLIATLDILPKRLFKTIPGFLSMNPDGSMKCPSSGSLPDFKQCLLAKYERVMSQEPLKTSLHTRKSAELVLFRCRQSGGGFEHRGWIFDFILLPEPTGSPSRRYNVAMLCKDSTNQTLELKSGRSYEAPNRRVASLDVESVVSEDVESSVSHRDRDRARAMVRSYTPPPFPQDRPYNYFNHLYDTLSSL